jgi:pilus assembly protein Flp/PilA
MRQFIEKLVFDDSGQDLIEYALAVALIGLLTEGAMKGLSNHVGNDFGAVGNSLTNAVA